MDMRSLLAKNKELMRELREGKARLEEKEIERNQQLNYQLSINSNLIELTKKQNEELFQKNSILEEKQQKLEEAYQQLQETKLFLEHIVDHYPCAVILNNEKGEVTTINKQVEVMFSINKEEVVSSSIYEILNKVMALPLERTREIYRITESGRSWQGELMFTRKNGQIFPGAVESSRVVDQMGKVMAYLLVIRDITHEKKFSDQLLKAERLSVMGQLAPKVAHEINNPLQVIFANLQLAMMNTANLEKLSRYLRASLNESERIKNLVSQLMDIAKPIPLSKEKINLPHLVEDSITFLKNVGEIKRYTIEREYEPNLPLFIGDRFQLEQVFRNLIINASDAMEMAEEKCLKVGVLLSHNRKFLEAYINDSGCGISLETKDKIFDPFFTTKRGSKGTGLGLAIVKDIIQRHSGQIGVESTPGKGSTFTIAFPLEPSAVEDSPGSISEI